MKNAKAAFLRILITLMLTVIPCMSFSAAGSKPVIMAHFMPWHQTPDVSGYWGYHWTMRHFNPENVDSTGRREIASHYYPLTGPYDSQDEHILEYQVLLMKLSGIDGVLVDWYGMEDFWDYRVLNEGTQALFSMIRKAGLSFSIVYEDQSIKHMVENGHLAQDGALAHGRNVMRYMQDNWFSDGAYLKLENRPVLLTFGPQYFMKSSDWETLFSGLPATPLFFTEDNRLSPAAAGAYPWPPMWKSNAAGVLTQAALNQYLDQFYLKAAGWNFLVAGAFPGFHDIYKEAGAGQGYGYLDAGDGATFRSTLRQALDRNPDVVQLVTWNDYGEGTMIEPTREFGYQYLEIMQEQYRAAVDSVFPFKPEDLTIPARILELRRTRPGEASVQSKLDRVFDRIISGDRAGMNAAMDSLSNPGCGGPISGEFGISPAYPNPFSSSTRFSWRIPGSAAVTITAYDSAGRRVGVLTEGLETAGCHSVEWKADGMGSGVYFVRMKAGDRSVTRKCVKVK